MALLMILLLLDVIFLQMALNVLYVTLHLSEFTIEIIHDVIQVPPPHTVQIGTLTTSLRTECSISHYSEKLSCYVCEHSARGLVYMNSRKFYHQFYFTHCHFKHVS